MEDLKNYMSIGVKEDKNQGSKSIINFKIAFIKHLFLYFMF